MRPSTLGLREVLQAEAQAKPSLPPSGDAPTANGLNGEPPHAHDASGPPPPLEPALSIDAQLQLDEINAEIAGAAPAPAFVDLSKVGTCAEGQLPISLDTGPAAAPPAQDGSEAHRQFVEAAKQRASAARASGGAAQLQASGAAAPAPAWFPVPAHGAQPEQPWWKGEPVTLTRSLTLTLTLTPTLTLTRYRYEAAHPEDLL